MHRSQSVSSDTTDQTAALTNLLSEANFCCDTILSLQQDFELLNVVTWRMFKTSQDQHFTCRDDEGPFRDANRRIRNKIEQLRHRLDAVLGWGHQSKLEIGESGVFLQLIERKTDFNLKSEYCSEYATHCCEVASLLSRKLLQRSTNKDRPNPANTGNAIQSGQEFYLFVCSAESAELSSTTVFYKVAGELLARSLCKMCTRHFHGRTARLWFFFHSISNIPADDQALMEEALTWLEVYRNLAIEDPEIVPPPGMIMRSECATCAQTWEKRFRTRDHERRNPGHAAVSVPEQNVPTLDKALIELTQAVEKHRLLFLICVRPNRRNPSNVNEPIESVDEHYFPERRIPDNTRDMHWAFLFRYRWIIDFFAQECIRMFGPGKGTKPTTDGGSEITGGSLPWWSVDDFACGNLEDSSDAILAACRNLSRADSAHRYPALARQARAIAHDEGQSKWYSTVQVHWNYLTKLDDTIIALKAAEVDYVDKEKSSNAASPLQSEPSSPKTTPVKASPNREKSRKQLDIFNEHEQACRDFPALAEYPYRKRFDWMRQHSESYPGVTEHVFKTWARYVRGGRKQATKADNPHKNDPV